MPRIRVVPLLLKDGPSLVKGQSFSKSRIIGPALPSIRVYQSRNVDELMVADVSKLSHDYEDIERFDWIQHVKKFLTMPLSVGGGIRSLSQIQYLIQNGADKVILNNALREAPELVTAAAERYGSQSLIGSIDFCLSDGKWSVYDSWLGKPLELELLTHIAEAQSLGIGELLLTSYANEGHMDGFELEILEYILGRINVPFVYSGGAGKLEHFSELLRVAGGINLSIEAIAASACFQFTGLTPREVSIYLRENGFDTRVPG